MKNLNSRTAHSAQLLVLISFSQSLDNLQFKHLVHLALIVLVFLVPSSELVAQSASGSCTSVTVNSPAYPRNLYSLAGGWKGPYFESSCVGETFSCARVLAISFGSMRTLNQLERLSDNGDWRIVESYSMSTTWEDLDHGTYRVAQQIPRHMLGWEVDVCSREFPNDFICVFNTNGQNIGFLGTYADPIFSNSVVVGPTLQEENSWRFRESRPSGSTSAADADEVILVDARLSVNYDLYYVAIFEEGDTYNSYLGLGWNSGQLGQFNLSTTWLQAKERPLEPFHDYIVQFVAENQSCRNGIEAPPIPGITWNVNTQKIFVCPAGTGCLRLDFEEDILAYPNPTRHHLNFEGLNSTEIYEASLYGIRGERILHQSLGKGEMLNLSDVPKGNYTVKLEVNGVTRHTAQIVVQ